MPQTYQFSLEEILKILPHRPPFLFVDRVKKMIPDKLIVTERLIREDEPYFRGHFPQKAIMPGVLVTDALAQTSGLLWGFTKKVRGADDSEEEPEIFYLAAVNMKFISPAYPGETLDMTARNEGHFGSFFNYAVEAAVKRKTVAKGTLTLAVTEGDL